MKLVLSLFFVLGGSLLLAAPMLIAFLQSVMGNRMVTVGINDRDVCTAGGGVLLFFGIIFSLITFFTSGKSAK